MEANYSAREFEDAKRDLMGKLLAPSGLSAEKHPTAFLLGGQSGAGKTALHTILKEKLSFNVVVINGDEYRSFHPRYYELDRQYGPESVAHTAQWAGQMTEALIDTLSLLRYNLIIEGTLRTAEVPMKTARLLRERSYAVSLALMAVKPEISLLSCQIRYEEMRIAGTVPRATDPAHHNKIVHDIVGNLDTLQHSELFDNVYLYTRSKTCLYPQEGEQRAASEVLRDVLFGEWTEQERAHQAFLEKRLAELREAPSRFPKPASPKGRR